MDILAGGLKLKSMEHSFWLQKWEKSEIGFHQVDVHELLRQYWLPKQFRPEPSETERVFVPLCGKSLDMIWLWQRGCHLYGNELAERAVEDFFNENKISFTVQTDHGIRIYKQDKLQVYQCDFWELRAQNLQDINVVYDRGALVALPDTMRQRYVQHLRYLAPQAAIFLISVEYETDLFMGPPFCLDEMKIRNLYADHYTIARLAENESTVRGFPVLEKLYWLESR